MASAERRGEPSGARGRLGADFIPSSLTSVGPHLLWVLVCGVFPGSLVVREGVVYPLRPPRLSGQLGRPPASIMQPHGGVSSCLSTLM